MGAYQAEAQTRALAESAGGRIKDALADLPKADLYVSLNAHPGRPDVLTNWMDASVVDESDPVATDASLDPFHAENGPPYSADFIARYRAAQRARNQKITDWAKRELAAAQCGRHSRSHLSRCSAPGPICGSWIRRSIRRSGPAPRCYRGQSGLRQSQPLRHRPRQHAARVAFHVEPRDLAVPRRAASGETHHAGARHPEPRRHGRVSERCQDDLRGARHRRDKTLEFLPGAHYFEDNPAVQRPRRRSHGGVDREASEFHKSRNAMGVMSRRRKRLAQARTAQRLELLDVAIGGHLLLRGCRSCAWRDGNRIR